MPKNKLEEFRSVSWGSIVSEMKKSYWSIFKLSRNIAGLSASCLLLVISQVPLDVVAYQNSNLAVLSSGYYNGGTIDMAGGTSDWYKPEGPACSNSNRKITGGGQISDCTPIGGTSGTSIYGRLVSWSDGTPLLSSAGDSNVITMTGNGNGFSFTVPADTTARTLYFYGYLRGAGNGVFTATLSDNSASPYTDSSYSNSMQVTYGIIYKANAPGQTLTVTWTYAGTGAYEGVGMYAVTLQAGTGPLTITSSSLPPATQYQSYSGPPLAAWGGTPPYTWTVTNAEATLPEGMTIDPLTGTISSAAVGGQGSYEFQVQVMDALGSTARKLMTISVAADNTLGGCSIFPADSIFHRRVDSLPVDTSPAAPIPSVYASSHIRVFFGADASPWPDGIPLIRVPYNQPGQSMTFVYGSESDPGPYPIPTNAPIEGSANSSGDHHILVLQTAGGGNPCKLYEIYGAGTGSGYTLYSGAIWDLSSDQLRPSGWTSSDAAGLPVMPLTVNYDEVASGVVRHSIRFTLNHTLANFVWPARHQAGIGYCTNSAGGTVIDTLISQSSPPVSCTMSGPMGEIYRLKADVDTSICNNSPQASVILTAMKQYGIILADNGSSGGLIGTPDSRWNDSDLACLGNFKLSQFEPVNVSSLQVNPDSGATRTDVIYVGQDGLCGGKSHCHTSIQSGIDSVQSSTILNITGERYNEQVIFDGPEEITVQGGWDTHFTSCSSYTAIHGSITITDGTIIIENVILE